MAAALALRHWLVVGLVAIALVDRTLLDLDGPQLVWSELVAVCERSHSFAETFDLVHALPFGNETWRDYPRVELALMEWHSELYALQDSVSSGEVDAAHAALLKSALARERPRQREFHEDDFVDGPTDKQYKKKKKTRKGDTQGTAETAAAQEAQKAAAKRLLLYEAFQESRLSAGMLSWLSRALLAYGVILLYSLSARDSVVSLLALLGTLALLPVIWKAKTLRSSLSGAVSTLRLRHVQLAGVFPSTSKAEMIAQHLILEKIDTICDFWEKRTLGLSFDLPFVGIPVSVDTELLATMVFANSVKLAKVVLALWMPWLGPASDSD